MDLYGEPGIIGVIKSQRIRWLGHMWRMKDERVVKAMLKSDISGKKKGKVDLETVVQKC